MSITIWHNPRCSKSRMTLQLLEEKGHQPTVRLYLEDAPSSDEITDALAALGMAPADLMRKGEAVYKELALCAEGVTDEARIGAMAENPILIERPIVFANNTARIGRPPESVLDIL